MKCVILAGGSGDSLWPLSRKNYPKQFMKFKEGRSLLQETVVRNLPYCDEFIIVTNEAYKNIVNGQMKAFQSLKYRVILEGTAKGTAAAIMLGTMFANPTEFVLVVNSDNFIDGDGYKDAIIGAKEIAKTGVIAAVGVILLPLRKTGVLRRLFPADFQTPMTSAFNAVCAVPASAGVPVPCPWPGGAPPWSGTAANGRLSGLFSGRHVRKCRPAEYCRPGHCP